MDREQPVVCRAQDVRLGEAGTVAGFRHFAEREVRGEGLDGKMRHRLEHRDFDEAALAGARTLEQHGEDAIRGIDAGDRIGERGAQEARPLLVHDDAQETGQRLRDGVVARPLGVWTVSPESADRAVNEPGIESAQPFDAGTEPFGGAGAEVLQVHVRICDQLVEDLAVARLLEVAAETPLVTVVGLEMRRIEPALVASIRIAFRALDLDHVGPEVGKHHCRAGARDERALLDDPDPAEW